MSVDSIPSGMFLLSAMFCSSFAKESFECTYVHGVWLERIHIRLLGGKM